MWDETLYNVNIDLFVRYVLAPTEIVGSVVKTLSIYTFIFPSSKK